VWTVNERHVLLTVREVADAMRVSTMTVYRLIRSGALPAIRVGKHFRIRERDLDVFLDAQTVGVGGGAALGRDVAAAAGGEPDPTYGGGNAWPAA
jgi:excisionase family DNA binding protein